MSERAISAADDARIFLAADFLPNGLAVIQFTDHQRRTFTDHQRRTASGAAADVEAWGGSHGGVDRLPLTVMAGSPTTSVPARDRAGSRNPDSRSI